MTAYPRRALLANIFGTFGYFSSLLLWVWVTIHYLPTVLDNDQVREILLPSEGQSLASPQFASPSLTTIVFAIIVTVVVLVVTMLVLLFIPVTIAKTGKAVTTKAANSIEPLIVHGRTLPPAQKRRLTISLIKLVKLLLVLVPVVAGLLSTFIPLVLPFEIVMFVTSILAGVSVFWFSVQYICADMLAVKPEKLV